MENVLVCELILILHDELVVGLIYDLILDVCLQVADGDIVEFTQVCRIFEILDCFSYVHLVLVLLFILGVSFT